MQLDNHNIDSKKKIKMNEIFAYRFKNARKICGFTMPQLAEKLGVSKQMISKYEKGLSIPDSPNLIKLANILNEKIDYFFRPAIFQLENVNFRKKSNYSESKINSLKARILKQMENYLIVEDILAIPFDFKNPIQDFKINSIEEVEKAAELIRREWNLGNDSIHNIISLLENNEIKVIEIDEPNQKLFDGLSSFVENKYPLIVYNKNFSIERKRFTLLHELGHLLLNIESHLEPEIEKLCNRFAGAMLLPKEIIIKEIDTHRENLSINELKNFQKQFGISISAIVYRLADLDVISENKKLRYFKTRNKNQVFKQECDAVRFYGNENSERFVGLVYKALSQEIISISKAAVLLNKSIEEVDSELSYI